MASKKGYSLEDLAVEIKLPKMAVHRSMDILISAGVINVDRTRSPWFYSYKKGAKPNIWPAFKFNDKPQEELPVRDITEVLLSQTKDYVLPERNVATHLIFAALYGMELEDVSAYEEWIEAVAAKIRAFYLAYRVIKTIQTIPVRERKLETWGINNKAPDQDSEDNMTMSLAYKQMFKDLLAQIPAERGK